LISQADDARHVARFVDGRSARSHIVSLEFAASALNLTSVDGEVWRWEYPSIRRLPAEGAGYLPLLSSLDMPDARLVLDDPELLAAFAERCRNLDALLKSDWRTFAVVSGWIGGAILLVALGYFGLPRLAGSFAPMIPESWETSLGDRAERSFEALLDAKPCPRGNDDAAISTLVAHLSNASAPGHKPHVQILRHAMVNAFALPGNRIVITTGMIAYLEGGDELAGILAHEMGHLQHHDPVTLLIDRAGWDALETAIFGLRSTGEFGKTLLSLSYSRDVEARADQSAIATLAAAHIDSAGFEHVMRRLATRGDMSLPYLSTHPPSIGRADAIAATGKPGDAAMSPDDWARFRANALACAPAPSSASR
jgi:Zn-dependent protease with chaperone function